MNQSVLTHVGMGWGLLRLLRRYRSLRTTVLNYSQTMYY